MKVKFVTGNMGKFAEVSAIFAEQGIELERLEDEYPEIQSDRLEDVVDWGLDWLWERHKQPIIIDDSGLFIKGLGGFPGVFSAYVFKNIGCAGILKLLDGLDDREAEFMCCAGYADEAGNKVVVFGCVEGQIIRREMGTGGFGYDPIFVPAGEERTFAQLSLEEKNSHSHRGKAFRKLAQVLSKLME
ncbi:MAG: hypothetical protein AYK23_01610 [Candidatus Proteinoplasmatales archaeon SG8-5]|nr:MAG: hypothetical protein AYK23_01610 [Candidatus Proteinoplasmatales archaeon SG8-5]